MAQLQLVHMDHPCSGSRGALDRIRNGVDPGGNGEQSLIVTGYSATCSNDLGVPGQMLIDFHNFLW